MRRLHLLVPTVLLVLLCGCAARKGFGGSDSTVDRINTQKTEAFDRLQSGDYEGVVAILRPLAEQRVKDSQIYSLLAEAQWKLGAYEDAVKNYESALRLDYSASDVHLDFGEMLMEMGKIGRALTEFELAVRFDERNPLPHYNYGLALYELGRREKALAEWDRAYSLDPNDPRYSEAMGIGLTGIDDREALRYFAIAGERGANGAIYHNNFGLLLKRLGQYPRAETEFKKALELEPDNDVFRFNLSAVYMNSGQYSLAIPLWEALLDRSPTSQSYRIYLGRAYYEERRFGDAIEVLETWLGRQEAGEESARDQYSGETGTDPGLDEAYDILAMSCRGNAKLDRAILYIEKALAIQPGSVMHLNNYGVILAENGMIDEAKAQWRKVLQLEPDNAVARQNLSAFDR